MYKYYAVPEESFQQRGGEPSDEMVIMDKQRPSEFSICRKISANKGEWVEPNWVKISYLKFQRFYGQKLMIYKIKLKIYKPIILSILLLVLSFVLIFLWGGKDWENYSISIFTGFIISIIFYSINDNFPRNKRAQFDSLRIQNILSVLVNLKDAQYRLIGFRSQEIHRKIQKEPAMDSEKSKKLTELMLSCKTYTIEPFTLGKYNTSENTDTIYNYFNAAHQILQENIVSLKECVRADTLPEFYQSLIRIEEILKFKKPNYMSNLSDYPENYEQYHFRLIEYIECMYNIECVPYVAFTPVARSTILEFSEEFKNKSRFPNDFQWS
jgi:hypothetical protein